MINYIVTITDIKKGSYKVECESVKEVWDAIGSGTFGSLYSVESPTGKDLEEFVPF